MVIDVGAPADWVKVNVRQTVSPYNYNLPRCYADILL